MATMEEAVEATKHLADGTNTEVLISMRYYSGNKMENRFQCIVSGIDKIIGCSEGDLFYEPAGTLEDALQNVVDGKMSDLVGWYYDRD